MTLPLEGRRVLDLSFALSGPWCTQILGAMGAEVIKVEPLGGDEGRFAGAPTKGSDSALFIASNSNKRSVAIALGEPEGQELIRRLAAGCDVFVQNLRPGAAERAGLGFERLRAVNPAIVYCSISAFGSRGPSAKRPGYDLLMQAVGGVMSTTGEEGGRPLRAGPPVVDLGAGMWAAIGILGALQIGDGEAHLVDTSLYEAAVNLHPIQFAEYAAGGGLPPRLGRSGNILVPFEVLPTADGDIVVTAGNDRLFVRLCEVIGRPELSRDPRFATNAARVENRPDLAEILGSVLRREPTATWIERLDAAGVPAGEINGIDAVAADPQFEALGMFAELDHPEDPELKVIAPPLSYDGERLPVRSAAPLLGADTDSVLAELGFSEADLEGLRERGILAFSTHD